MSRIWKKDRSSPIRRQSSVRFVIIGNGVAGVNAARIIKNKDSEAEVHIYAEEAYHYYSRPRLINFLPGEISLDELYFYPEQWYKEKGIEVHLNSRAEKIDLSQKKIVLSHSEEISYERLLLATGSSPSLPPIKNVEKQGVFTLRTLADALAIRDYAKKTQNAIVIGGGVLGLEAARGLKALGLDVTVMEFFPRLLPRQLDEEGAGILKRLIENTGINVFLNSTTSEILGDAEARGILLSDQQRVNGELILISAGIRSNIDLAKEAGIAVNKGIVVNNYLATNFPDIYAAGDVAEHQGKIYGIIPAALEQSEVAASNMLGEAVEYQGTVPSNTLKVVGIDLTSIGIVNPEEDGYEELRMVDEDRGIYKKAVIKDGLIVGAILLGEKKDVAVMSKIIKRGVNVAQLKDKLWSPDFDLKTSYKDQDV